MKKLSQNKREDLSRVKQVILNY